MSKSTNVQTPTSVPSTVVVNTPVSVTETKKESVKYIILMFVSLMPN